MYTFFSLVCCVLALWYIFRRRHLNYFKNLDIPGPEPNFLFGNILELYYKEPIKCFDEWIRKYGRVFGFFYGMNPVLLVADPELLKTIFIKDFQKFMDREPVHPTFEYSPDDKDAQTVLILPGKKWKEIRSVLTPTFTAAKLKQMAGSMNASVDTMMSILQERAKKGQDFDISDTYQRVTTDIITRTAFGIRTEVQTDMESRILRATKLLFSTPYRDPLIFVGLCFPSLRYILRQLLWVILAALNKGEKPMAMLRKRLMEVLHYRKENPQGGKKDLLQLMIDTKIYSNEKEVDTKHLEIGNAESEAKFTDQDDSNKAYRKMTDDEIVSSSFTVLLAGYETTSTALTFTTYLLAKYPDVQDKLYDEVRNLIQSGQKLEYATINQLQYLDKVFCESMRVYPPVYSFQNRFATEDVQYGDLKIPKGTLIQAATYHLHHDPEFWEDPEKFDPERFSTNPNANGITYLPFGVGPRNCLGMRLAQLEAKLVLAHVFYKFRVTLGDSHKEPLETVLKIRTISPKNGIPVKVTLRNDLDS